MNRREAVTAASLSILAALVFTWPLVLHPLTRLAAPTGPGDPFLNCWILGWDLGTITRDPAALFTGRIFDANIFFPASRTLAYSDHLILQAIALTPLYILTGSPAFCYNTLLFVSTAASVLAMYGFVRAVTGSRGGAALAGLAWGVMPFRVAHLLHLQLQSLYFLPLAFLFLHRLMAGRRRRDAVLLGIFAALQAISSVYWGVIGGIGLGVAAIGLAVGVGRWRSGLIARRLLLAAVVGAVIVAPFAWPYWQVQQREGFSRNLYEASQHEAVAASYVRVPPGNLLYGRTGLLRARAGAPPAHEGPEQELFPGLVLASLALCGAWVGWRRDARPTVMAMAAVSATGFVLSLGPGGVRSVYAFLHQFVFGFQAIRAPARFGVLVVFGLAVLAALAVREIEGRLRRAGRARAAAGLSAALIALAGLEYLSVPLPTVPAPESSSAVGRWLAREPGAGAVLYLPLDDDLGNTPAMVQSLEHRRPIVNGYSGQRPAFFMGLVDTLNEVPAADALWTLRDLNVRFVVSPRALPRVDGGPLVERATLAGGTIYELRWTGDAEAALPRPDPPPPPEPGPMPFGQEETLVYDVSWRTSVATGLPAGTATFTAGRAPVPDGAPAGPTSPRHLAVDVQTAAWVARFFEARDRIETWADDRLIPIRQEQHLREGRRVVDRATRFDVATRTLTIAEGPPLPWPREARDGVSAFFYVRTLPLAPGYSTVFPLVEGGRRYAVDLRVDGIERITVGGRQVEAFRATPRLSSIGERGRTVQSTIWIGTDARRLPLVLEVETAFGSFHIELQRESSR
jgi:hypothetical protein